MEFKSFEDLFEIPLRNGLTKPKKVRGVGYKMVNMGELFAIPRINNAKMDRVPLTDNEKESSILVDGDLLFARQSLVRKGAGQCSIFIRDEEEVCFESHIIRCRLNQEIANPLFYYYFFRSWKGKQTIDAIIEQGAGASGIRGSDLAKLQVPYIEKYIQDEVAAKLNTIDDKIELNHQINQTLEQIAQTIFKSWFVDFEPVKAKIEAKQNGQDPERAAMRAISGKTDEELDQLSPEQRQQLTATSALFSSELEDSELGEIPKGWSVEEVGSYGKVITGKTPPKIIECAYGSVGLPFITPTDIENDVFVTNTNRFLSAAGEATVKNNRIPAGSICVTCIGSQMGKTIIASRDSYTNQQVNSIIVNDDPSRNYLFLNLRGRREEIFLIGSSGSTMPILNKSTFERLKVLVPNKKLVEKFQNTTDSMFQAILANSEQSRILIETRDSLLPKHLSGEVSLDSSQTTMEAVAV